MKLRKRLYDPEVIYEMIEFLSKKIADDKSQNHIISLINKKLSFYKEELDKIKEKEQKGKELFTELQDALLKSDNRRIRELAEVIEYADYHTSKDENILRVKLEEEYRGSFIGRGGANIRLMQDLLGVKIDFEKYD
jgi:transcription antitermination factor NusA-like protein